MGYMRVLHACSRIRPLRWSGTGYIGRMCGTLVLILPRFSAWIHFAIMERFAGLVIPCIPFSRFNLPRILSKNFPCLNPLFLSLHVHLRHLPLICFPFVLWPVRSIRHDEPKKGGAASSSAASYRPLPVLTHHCCALSMLFDKTMPKSLLAEHPDWNDPSSHGFRELVRHIVGSRTNLDMNDYYSASASSSSSFSSSYSGSSSSLTSSSLQLQPIRALWVRFVLILRSMQLWMKSIKTPCLLA